MSARILDGNAVANAIQARVAEELQRAGAPKITLVTVIVGDHGPSQLYVNLKLKRARAAGLTPTMIELPADVTQAALEQQLAELGSDNRVHGILLQLPLPDHLDTRAVLEILPPDKDVDGLTRASFGALLCGEPGLVPCTPLGVMRILEHYEIPVSGRRAVIVGRSYLVGLPQALLLVRKGVDATPTLCHSRTKELAAVCREADILIAAAGSAGLVTAECVKPGATVIDVGVNYEDGGKVCGDVAFEEAKEVAGAITPMPGGTGPATVACLIENTLTAAKMQGAVSGRTGNKGGRQRSPP